MYASAWYTQDMPRARAAKYNAATIRALREAAELTQQELATQLGVSMSCVSLWERGLRAPERHTEPLLDRFVKRYGLDIEPLDIPA